MTQYSSLRQSQDDLSSLCESLGVRTNARVSHLSGILPLPETQFPETEKWIYDFSALTQPIRSTVSWIGILLRIFS